MFSSGDSVNFLLQTVVGLFMIDYIVLAGLPSTYRYNFKLQVQFSLLSMGNDQLELKAVCDSLGIRLIAYSPLGLGMLTGKYATSNLPRGPR